MTLPFKPEHIIDGSIESKDITAVELEPGLLSIDAYYLSPLTGEWTARRRSDSECGIQLDTDTVRRLLPIARTFLATEEHIEPDAFFWIDVRDHSTGRRYRTIGRRSSMAGCTDWSIVGTDAIIEAEDVTMIATVEPPS